MSKLIFSGHETFICKQHWLIKGYHFVKEKKKFTDDDAVVHLGVGKNMVNSIRYWLKSFSIIDKKDVVNEIADYIFGKDGVDKFFEDIGTYWLYHYFIVNENVASIFNIIFKHFRLEKTEFSKEQLLFFIKKFCSRNSENCNEKTINNDISVFLRTYVREKDNKLDTVEDYSNFLHELNLIKHYKGLNLDNDITDYYSITDEIRPSIPSRIFLFTLLHNKDYGSSITINEIYNNEGRIFALTREDIKLKIKELTKIYNFINYSETAGNQVLQFKKKPDSLKILNDYYKL